MDKRLFKDLLQSVKEMKLIMAGKMKPARVTRIEIKPISIKGVRKKLHQSQSEFAFMIGVSPSTLKNWEQGTREPEGAARALLTVAQKNPKAVYQALHA